MFLGVFPYFALSAQTVQPHPKLPISEGVDGRPHNLIAESHGRPIALVFVSHDCPICNSYAPELARIARDYGNRILFGIVYAEPDLSRPAAASHARAYGLASTELLWDPKGRLASASAATITPEAAVFDRGGARAYLGRIDNWYYDFGKARTSVSQHDLRRAIDAVLNHRPATPAAGPPFGCVIEAASK